MTKRTKLVLGLPWYSGPDETTFPLYFCMMAYFGALRERTIWRERIGHENFMKILPDLPPLDESKGDNGLAEPTEEDWMNLGVLDLAICDYSRTSLVGKAREHIAEAAIACGADYILWWDKDMRFEYSAFLRIWRRQLPVVAALAFTARHPIHPVIYTIQERRDQLTAQKIFESSTPIFDYPRDKLISNDDVGGELAFGSGVMLTDTRVFKQIPQPWFASTGCGEDWFFCHRCMEFKIPRYMDTGVKTQHKEHKPRWSDEAAYWKDRELIHDQYAYFFGNIVPKYTPPAPEQVLEGNGKKFDMVVPQEQVAQ